MVEYKGLKNTVKLNKKLENDKIDNRTGYRPHFRTVATSMCFKQCL